jgi:hypothetical protein
MLVKLAYGEFMKSEKARKRLLQAIKKAGSQRAFALEKGVRESTISQLVNGTRGFGDKTLKALGLEIDYVNIRN